MATTPEAKAARADAAIRRMLPRCSDAMLSALRMRLIHAEQLRRLGVERHGEVGSKAVVKGD